MEKELKELLQASKEYITYQSIGNGAKLNCAIENAEKVLDLGTVVGQSEQLTCECPGLGNTECHKINDKWICSRCNRPLAG